MLVLPLEINNFFYFRGSWNGVSRCASCCLIDLQQLQYNLSMFICLSLIFPFFLFNIDVAIITQKYLSFHRILKRSAFASHSICIENIVDLIILDLPMKLPKAGKLFLSIFSAAIQSIDVHLSFLNCPFLSFQYWRCNHNSKISFIS